jgi:hypothetical protein
MRLTVKKLLIISSMIFIAGIMLFSSGCGSGVTTTTPTTTTAGPATKLVFTTQPAGGIAGSPFDTQPVVAAVDAAGKTVTGYKGLIELTISARTGNNEAKLSGGTKVLSTNGVSVFTYLSMDKAAANYTLTASCGNLTPAVSAPFGIKPGAPSRLAFTVQPSEATAGIPMTPGPELVAQDNYGNTVTGFEGAVTVEAYVSYEEYTEPNQAKPTIVRIPTVFSGTKTVRAVNGLIRFTNLSGVLSRPNYTFTASADSIASATSSFFTILHSDPVKLEFTVQPAGCIAGIVFDEQPKVAILDSFGNVATSTRATISVALAPAIGTSGAVLSGTNTVLSNAAYGGLSAYEDLSINLPGSGYVLTANSKGFPAATSQPFDVTAPEK